VVFGTSIDNYFIINELNRLEMKARQSIKKWTEPLTYVVLVAAFGFLSTMVTHARSEDPVQEKDLVSFTIENELEALFSQIKESKEVSL
jgi:hypothetical protein